MALHNERATLTREEALVAELENSPATVSRYYNPTTKSFTDGHTLSPRDSFADIGATVLENFGLRKADNQIGTSIDELLK
ncbi:MAG: hypothetical protein HUJ56_01745 [Erysipelotrichaceae bacterium]|nr:hypothetical protein [Erysipelotrichaceae bacterium]